MHLFSTDWQFRNSKKALVGQVVSDGLIVRYNSAEATLSGPVDICTEVYELTIPPNYQMVI